MTVAPTGAAGGTRTTFGLGFRKCQPAKVTMRAAAPTAIGIRGSLLPAAATELEEAVAICASRMGARSARCGGKTNVPEPGDTGVRVGAAITPDRGGTSGAAITPEGGETAGAATPSV